MTTAPNPFQPAVKEQLKARVALDGPTGSGKTWTALGWATVLAGPDAAERRPDGLAHIALIDTERMSASLYAPHFCFDVVSVPPPYDVAQLIANLHAAEAAGYAVAVIDSWSHYWEGEGGVLDEVDGARRRSNGDPTGWQHGTPLQRNMVDVILGLDIHVLVTMRSKMEYVIEEYEENGRKKTRVEKVGMRPVQRAGVEYEFTVVGDMDLDHRITISKSRCDVLADKVIQPNREREAAATFLEWLNDGEPPPPRASEDDVAAFLARVKEQPDGIRAAMNAWWKERGFVSAKLTEPELEEARGHLADLLIDANDLDSGEPAPRGAGDGDGDDAPAGERSEDAPAATSNGHAAAASPDADGGGEASTPDVAPPPDARTKRAQEQLDAVKTSNGRSKAAAKS